MPDINNDLQTMQAAAADIQRWLLLIALEKRISVDRRMDIIRQAERIIALTKGLAQ